MKRVGVILREYKSISNKDLLAIRKDLLEYLRNYDIEIIMIPILFNNKLDLEYKKVIKIIKKCRGIILPGGSNIDEIDLKITKFLHQKNIPTLGICSGMQIMALTFDGKIDKLKNDTHQSDKEYVHKVNIIKNTKLERILGSNEILVNSRHNDYIKTTNLKKCAFNNNILEAVEDNNKKFFIGVEWHPESLKNDIYSKRLFDSFIDSL